MTHRSTAFHATSFLVLVAQVLFVSPELLAATIQERQADKAKPAAPPVKVNRTQPKVTPPPTVPVFSDPATDAEIFRARVFGEPLVPVGRASNPAENTELSRVLLQFLNGAQDVSPIEAFLEAHPESAWRLSLLTNLANVYRRTGYFTKALATWQQAWELGKGEETQKGRAVADNALGGLLDLTSRLGRTDDLEKLLDEIKERDVRGSASERVERAKQAIWLFKNQADESYRCGPLALDRILAATRANYTTDPRIGAFKSTKNGTSLVQVVAVSREAGLNLQAAKREPGADYLLPSVVHFRAGHFAALLKQQGGRYLLQDPTFGEEFWVTRQALDEETSGYFAVAEGKLPAGWNAASLDEAGTVWGKGGATGQNGNATSLLSTMATSCSSSQPSPMAAYSFHVMLVNLHITDTPVGYSPPRGPAPYFAVAYNHREAFQPQIFSFSNLGSKWSFDWLSYLEDDPANGAQPLHLYLRGGGGEDYTDYNAGTQSFGVHRMSQAIVVRISTSPIRYERRLPDGSIEVFAQPDGAATFPRRVLLTEVKDPAGNTLTLSYDGSLRLVGVTDAIGQVTTLSYELGSDPLKITKVTDPFGRFAALQYNAAGQLSSITDIIGITSSFVYGASDFITSLTTPYGTTQFSKGENGLTQRWLQAVDPQGGMERVEFRNAYNPAPTGQIPAGSTFTNSMDPNSYYWDKKAMSIAPGDITKAKMWAWFRESPATVATDIPLAIKEPFEYPVWYSYAGMSAPGGHNQQGTLNKPSKISRVLDDGTTQNWLYDRNAVGKIIKQTDPLGRETVYVYGTNNVPDANQVTGSGIDLLAIKQKNPASAGGYDLLQSYSYNSQHLPLTATDASGQTTTRTYNAFGQVLTVITPPRASLTAAERTTTFSYDANGYRESSTGPVPGATEALTYDGYGRVRTSTDADSYTVTYDYDAADRVTKATYPDATTDETAYNRLDAEFRKDRLGRTTQTIYDALRRVSATRDAAGRVTNFQWCNCGGLERLVDSNGNATTWVRDAQSRVTREIRANGSYRDIAYENTTSRLKQVTDAKSQVIGYQYFLDDKLKQVTYTNEQNPTSDVSFSYDTRYDRLATMVDGTGTTTWAYNAVGQPPALGAARLASIDGALSNDLIAYSYDELGQMTGRSIDGVAQTQAYDALGRMTSQTNALGAFTYSYQGVTGRLASVSYPNGQVTTFDYETNAGDHRLKEIWNKFSGGATLSKFNYGTDAGGSIKTWTQQLESNAAKQYDFGYDAADQIISAVLKTTDPSPIILKRYGYDYDKAGNRTTEQIDDSAISSTHDNMNRLTNQQPGGALTVQGTVNEGATVLVQGKPASVSATNVFEAKTPVTSGTNTVTVQASDATGNVRTNTYEVTQSGSARTLTYDANGSLTGDGTRSYDWDAENRLVAVKQGATTLASFVYDGHGRRRQKTAGGITHSYVLDNDHVAEERLAGSTTGTVRYFHGPGADHWLGRQNADSSKHFFVRDHLGSISTVTDNSGAVVNTREYDPWGNMLQGSLAAGPAFTGREWDPETGLYYYRARYYYPKLGRFLSEDPVGVAGGPNFYEYVSNAPTNRIDPSGLTPWRPKSEVVPCLTAAQREYCEAKCANQGGVKSCNIMLVTKLKRQLSPGGSIYIKIWVQEVVGPPQCTCNRDDDKSYCDKNPGVCLLMIPVIVLGYFAARCMTPPILQPAMGPLMVPASGGGT